MRNSYLWLVGIVCAIALGSWWTSLGGRNPSHKLSREAVDGVQLGMPRFAVEAIHGNARPWQIRYESALHEGYFFFSDLHYGTLYFWGVGRNPNGFGGQSTELLAGAYGKKEDRFLPYVAFDKNGRVSWVAGRTFEGRGQKFSAAELLHSNIERDGLKILGPVAQPYHQGPFTVPEGEPRCVVILQRP